MPKARRKRKARIARTIRAKIAANSRSKAINARRTATRRSTLIRGTTNIFRRAMPIRSTTTGVRRAKAIRSTTKGGARLIMMNDLFTTTAAARIAGMRSYGRRSPARAAGRHT